VDAGRPVDLSLNASLPYGSTTLMPEPHVFGAWSASIVERVQVALTDMQERNGRIVSVLGGNSDLEVQAHCKSDGVVSLNGVAISGFRTVKRVRDAASQVEDLVCCLMNLAEHLKGWLAQGMVAPECCPR
jgi:hypothetical protein